jgi:hypothetical protein
MVRDVAGPTVPEETVKLCAMSIINQCRGFILMQKSRLKSFDDFPLTPERADQIAEHIADFSIAGIAAIRKRAMSTIDE